LTFTRDPQRSRLSLQERELESEDNIFIIHPSYNHNFENFTVGSYQIGFGSGIMSSSVGSFWIVSSRSGRISGHLVSGHFGFRIVSSWVGSGIESSIIGLFRILNRIGSGIGYLVLCHFVFRIVSDRVSSHSVSNYFESDRVLSPPLLYQLHEIQK
jgi:hypothetical protein